MGCLSMDHAISVFGRDNNATISAIRLSLHVQQIAYCWFTQMHDFATHRRTDADKNLLRCDSCSGMDFSQNFGEKCDKILGCVP